MKHLDGSLCEYFFAQSIHIYPLNYCNTSLKIISSKKKEKKKNYLI